MRIYLVRHGQTEFNVNSQHGAKRPENDPLTKLGRKQVYELTKFIKTFNPLPKLIVSSPYFRAKQTSDILAKELGLKIKYEDDLREYNIGDWREQHKDNVHANFLEINAMDRYIFRPPKGESWLDEAQRFKRIIDKIQNRNIDSVIMVSHYDPIKAVVSYLTKYPIENWFDNKIYEPGTISLIEGQNDYWALVFSNRR